MKHFSRTADYSAGVAEVMRDAVVAFVRGIRRPRTNGVTTKQILAWFPNTPEAYVHQGINDAIGANLIQCGPRSMTSSTRWNGVNEYWIKETA